MVSRTFHTRRLILPCLQLYSKYDGVVEDSSFSVDMKEETNEERQHERRYEPDERMNEQVNERRSGQRSRLRDTFSPTQDSLYSKPCTQPLQVRAVFHCDFDCRYFKLKIVIIFPLL